MNVQLLTGCQRVLLQRRPVVFGDRLSELLEPAERSGPAYHITLPFCRSNAPTTPQSQPVARMPSPNETASGVNGGLGFGPTTQQQAAVPHRPP
jgi:hypothetical protein